MRIFRRTQALTNMKSDELVVPAALAEELHVSEGTLAVWRSTGRYDIPYVKVGSRVRYPRSGIEAWKVKRTHGKG